MNLNKNMLKNAGKIALIFKKWENSDNLIIRQVKKDAKDSD